MNAKEFVKKLDLSPHPEGGFYKETYRSQASTGIYYLLERGQKSSLHRIKSDEMWHFYAGDSLMIVEINAQGEVKETRLNKDLFQYVVPAGMWFGAYLPQGSEFALVGCTVAPAFRFEDFEMGDKHKLLELYPGASEAILRLNP